MNLDKEKYNKVINLLKISKPRLESAGEIEDEVIRRITCVHPIVSSITRIFDFLFSWVYIGWVRRSLIAAAVALIVIFIYQQGVILKRIDFLSRQTIVIGTENILDQTDQVEKILMNYKNEAGRFPLKTITISEKQMKELIESVNELQLKYKDLKKLIEDDPEIRRLIENSRTKI